MSYIEHKLWSDLEPTKPVIQWIAEKVLCIPQSIITENRRDLRTLIYRAYFGLRQGPNKYITRWNSTRTEIVASLVQYPGDNDLPNLVLRDEPLDEDISYWLLHYVLLFSDTELMALVDISEADLDDPGYQLVPLLKSCHRKLVKIKLHNPMMQDWHKARHVMIRYYLDAVYHEI